MVMARLLLGPPASNRVELLRRGFHIAFVAPDPGRQGKAWDVWYKFLTENHGLAKKAAFIGMSKGGVNEFDLGVANPDKVACIYADNPALWDEDFAKFPELAKHDIPLLHVVGTEDFVLRYTKTLEKIYHPWGGSITLIMKEGFAHHPHSLIDPTLIADSSSSISIRSRRTGRRSPTPPTPKPTTTAWKIPTFT